MQKSILLLLSACVAQVVMAGNDRVWIENNDGSKGFSMSVANGYRFCYCISKTQTALINAKGGGSDVKLFSSSDCTGNYANGTGKITYNAQWVNSISFGASGIPSIWGAGKSCSWY